MLHTREHQDCHCKRGEKKTRKADQLLKAFITNTFLEPQNIKGSFSFPLQTLWYSCDKIDLCPQGAYIILKVSLMNNQCKLSQNIKTCIKLWITIKNLYIMLVFKYKGDMETKTFTFRKKDTGGRKREIESWPTTSTQVRISLSLSLLQKLVQHTNCTKPC